MDDEDFIKYANVDDLGFLYKDISDFVAHEQNNVIASERKKVLMNFLDNQSDETLETIVQAIKSFKPSNP